MVSGLLAAAAQMTAGVVAPAQFADTGLGSRRLRGFAEGGIDGEFEIQLLAAAVAVHLPVMDGQLLELWSFAYRQPLTGRVDQMANLFHVQARSEEHTSELQSRENLVCRLLLE